MRVGIRKLISLEHGDSQRSKSVLQCGEMHILSFGYLSVMVLGSRKYFARKEDNVRNQRANDKDKKDTRKGGLKTGLRLSDSYPTQPANSESNKLRKTGAILKSVVVN